MKRRKIVKVEGGLSGRLHLACLYIGGAISQCFQFRGMQAFSWALGRYIFAEDNAVIIELEPETLIKIHLNDGYWTKTLFASHEYEPELHYVLKHFLTGSKVAFVDCGANIGYWSVLAARWLSAEGKVLAIEASPINYARLVVNADLNPNRIETLLAAVWSSDGEILQIVGHKERHAGSSVVNRRERLETPGYVTHEIRSQTIDTACKDLLTSESRRFILKLDVEDAELPALRGAQEVLKTDPLLIYEDHGQSEDHLISNYVAGDLGMQIFCCSSEGIVTHVESDVNLNELKNQKFRGYNFFACSPTSWFAPRLIELASRESRSGPGRA